MQVTTRNAHYQQWQTLLTNRTKRHRQQSFIVQGVRPIDSALKYGWEVREFLHRSGRLSDWARQVLETVDAAQYEVADNLLAELGEKTDGPPELLAVIRMASQGCQRIPPMPNLLVMVLDRPSNPGNIGMIIRSADALGAHGVVVTGHAADIYDPKSIRSSRGSLFALPTVRVDGIAEVAQWVEQLRAEAMALQVIGTDETGMQMLGHTDLTGPTMVVVGNETSGMSAAARSLCQTTVRIPMQGSASSLNAAAAATVVMYEASRQRLGAGLG